MDAESIVLIEEEDKRASRLARIESGARTFDSIVRVVTTSAARVLLTASAAILVFWPGLTPWLRDVVGDVLRGAFDSGFGFAVPLIVGLALFRKELAKLFVGEESGDGSADPP